MIDRRFFDHFSAALAFAVLAGGTAAIGSELWTTTPGGAAATAMRVVQLERVVVTGHRLPASAPLARADSLQPASQRLQ